MTTKTTQWAAKSESADERDSLVPSPPAEFLIANLELESRLSHRKPSPLRISNRKYFAIFYPATRPNRTQWHRPARQGGHSCLPRSGSQPPKVYPEARRGLCAVADPRTQRMAEAAVSLSVGSQNSNRDTAIRIPSKFPDCIGFQISNRDKKGGFASVSPAANSQLLPQIDPAFARAYTYISPKEKPSWKIPSY